MSKFYKQNAYETHINERFCKQLHWTKIQKEQIINSK